MDSISDKASPLEEWNVTVAALLSVRGVCFSVIPSCDRMEGKFAGGLPFFCLSYG